eukprot:scaffold4011_cov197-Ochromonas_danica.AAC.16
MILLDLCEELAISLLVEWLTLRELPRLDVACTNHYQRPLWYSLLAHPLHQLKDFPKHNFSLPLYYRWLLNRGIKVTVLPFRAEVLPEIVDIENLSFPCVTRLEGSPSNNVEPSALRVFIQACPRLEILMDSHLGPNDEAILQCITSLAREGSLRYLRSLRLAYGSKYSCDDIRGLFSAISGSLRVLSTTGCPPLSEAMLSTIASVEGLHLTKLCLWTSSVSMSGLLQFCKKMTGLEEVIFSLPSDLSMHELLSWLEELVTSCQKLSGVYMFFDEGNRAISDNRGFLPDIGKLWDLNPQFLHLTVQGCLDLERSKQPLCQCTLDLIAAYSPNDASRMVASIPTDYPITSLELHRLPWTRDDLHACIHPFTSRLLKLSITHMKSDQLNHDTLCYMLSLCSGLEVLSSNMCMCLTDRALEIIATSMHSLKEIHLAEASQFTDKAMQDVFLANPRLSSISIPNCRQIGDGCLNVLSQSARPPLERLIVQGTAVTSQGLCMLAEGGKLDKIKTLQVDSNVYRKLVMQLKFLGMDFICPAVRGR